MSAEAERAFAVITPVEGRWVAKIYGVRGKQRRLAITATGSLDYARRVSAVYCRVIYEEPRQPRKHPAFTKARAVATSKAANDCEAL